MEEKNFLVGAAAASLAAVVYILFEHFYAPMPVEWRVAVTLLTVILCVLAHAVLKKPSAIRTVTLFVFLYGIPILHRREIMSLIKNIGSVMDFGEKTKYIYLSAAAVILAVAVVWILIRSRHKIAKIFASVKRHPWASAALLWSAAAAVIFAWCGCPKEKEFFGALIQWTAYFLSAAGVVIVLSGLTILTLCAFSKIKKTSFTENLDVGFFVCFYIILFAGLYFAFEKGELYSAIKNMAVVNKRTDASMQIIKYIVGTFGISFIAAMAAVNSVTKSFLDLYGTKLVFGVRDLIGKVLGIFAQDGLVMGAVTDIFELFTGKNDKKEDGKDGEQQFCRKENGN